MRCISVGLILYVDDDIAADYETMRAYLESSLFAEGGLDGRITTTADITDQVEARLKEMMRGP